MIADKVRVLYIDPIPPEVGGRFYGGIATHLWETFMGTSNLSE